MDIQLSEDKPSTQVVFVDDDRFYCQPWISELRTVFPVEYFRSAGQALDCILSRSDRIMLVLDLMMPPPRTGLEVETENGQITGIWVLKQCARFLRATESPVILLTNTDMRVVCRYLSADDLAGIRVQVMAKRAATPGSLIREVKALVFEADSSPDVQL